MNSLTFPIPPPQQPQHHLPPNEMSESQPLDHSIRLVIVGVIALIAPIAIFLIVRAIERRRLAASARNRGDDLEMQDTSPATHAWSTRARQSYDSARDGFVPTSVYGGRSLVSYGGFVEADVAERRGSVDTLADMEDMVSPKTIPAPQAFVYAGVRAEGDGERGEEFVEYVIGVEEPEGPACEDELEGVKRNVEELASPDGLGISGGLDVGESDIQTQLEMLDGSSSAEDVWSCEVVETFRGCDRV